MDSTEKKRSFIIKFLYFGLWAAIIFCVLKYAMPLFMPFVIAFVISFILRKPINKLAEKTPLSRKVAAILTLVLVYVVLVSLLVLLGVRIGIYVGDWFADLPRLYAQSIEPAIASIGNFFDDFIYKLDPQILAFVENLNESISSAVSSLVSTVSSGAASMLGGFASRVPWIVVSTFLCIIASFFFVVDYNKITGFINSQFSAAAYRKFVVIKDYVAGTLFKFFRAYLIIMLITFAEVSVGLLVLQVSSPFLIAAITAIVDIVPVLGTGTIILPWAVFSIINGNYFLGIGLLVLYAVITVVRQILEPRIVGHQIGLYPLLTLICMFIGARVFGFWGMLGFPIALTVLIYLNRVGEISFFKMPAKTGAEKQAKNPDEPKEMDP